MLSGPTARFADQVGTTPIAYLLAWRMALAKDALTHSDQTIDQIARDVGYGSASAFSNAFHRFTGSRPGRDRRHWDRASAQRNDLLGLPVTLRAGHDEADRCARTADLLVHRHARRDLAPVVGLRAADFVRSIESS